MVLDLGLLGDSVHLLPALWAIHQACPQAELHVTISAHVTSLGDCVPWIARVWGYTRWPKRARLGENLRFIAEMRREKFDAVINLNSSDRSSWLSLLSGAPERLGRVPEDGGPLFWKRMFTAHVDYPYSNEPVFLQRFRCLERAGFPVSKPEFRPVIAPSHLAAAGLDEKDRGTYFHISPFTTADYKELPPAQVAGLVGALAEAFPEKKIILSCSGMERELKKMEELRALLPVQPWRIFAGTLGIAELAAVIQASAVHFCGDTGPLHLAAMVEAATVVWFWPNPGIEVWKPVHAGCRVVRGTLEPETTPFLCNVRTPDLLAAARSVLEATAPACSASG